jgi:energy-coupling factor transporter ATP-binding protein EcfA2
MGIFFLGLTTTRSKFAAMPTVDIGYWDPNSLREGAIVLVVGRRGSGKSTLAADILSYQRGVKRGLVISATERSNEFWGKHVPACFIHYQFEDKLIQELFDMQQKSKDKLGKAEPAFCVLDDLLYDTKFTRSKMIRQLMFNGRHSNIFTLITSQYLVGLGPELRGNVDYVCALQDNIVANRERLYVNAGGVFPTFKEFDEVMKACTENREAMILDQTNLSYSISECVKFYRATAGLRFRVGAEEYWEFSAGMRAGDSGAERAERGERALVRKRYPTRDEDGHDEPREESARHRHRHAHREEHRREHSRER